MTISVGILDSGIAGEPARRVAASRCFGVDRSDPEAGFPLPLPHGTEVARIVVALAPDARLLDARIFADRLTTDAATAAAGLLWLVEIGARVVTLSFGLREDRAALAAACRVAVEAGLVLIAASPARGPAVFPAAYPGVIRACGDARCGPDQVSALGGEPADFGACPRPWSGAPDTGIGGASFAAAYVAGHAAAFLAEVPHGGPPDVIEHLDRCAAFHGRERRHA